MKLLTENALFVNEKESRRSESGSTGRLAKAAPATAEWKGNGRGR